MAQAPTTALSTGTLFYLFGDRVAPKAGMLGGTKVPCSEEKVSKKDLAALLFAVSFWKLKDEGIVELETFQTKSLIFFKQIHVRVTVRGATGQRNGFEDIILQRVQAGTDRAYQVIYNWFGEDVTDPSGHVIHVAVREMLERGLADEVDTGRGGISGLLLGKKRVEPRCDQVAAQRGRFDEVLDGWQRFQSAQPALAKALVDTCKGAIGARQESDNDSGGSD